MSGSVRALAELRARLLWRRFTARGGIAEGVATVVLLAIAVPVGLAFAGAVGAGAFQSVRARGGLRTDVGAVAIFFGLWQTWTAVSLTLNDREGLDLRRFLVFPVAPGKVYAMGLATGVAGDPMGVAWATVLLGVLVGAAAARPGVWVLVLLLLLVAFAAATVVYAALIQEALAAVLTTRRVREWAMVGSVALSVGVLLVVVWGAEKPFRSARDLLPVLRVAQWAAWPAAFSAGAARELFAGRTATAMPWMAGLVATTAVAGWVSFRIAIAQALGGGGSGGSGTAGASRAIGRGLPGGAFGALVEKEARFLLRHPLARVSLLLAPVIMAFVALKVEPRIPAEAGDAMRALPLLGAAIYAHLLAQALWLNAFGWERGGARTIYLAPVELTAVLRAKALVLVLFDLMLFAAATAPFLVLGRGSAPRWAWAAALVLHLAAFPWLVTPGYLVSVLRPKAASFALQRNSAVSTFVGLVGMGITSGVTGLFALPDLLALRADSPAALLAGWSLLGLAGLGVAWWAWPRLAGLLGDRRDEFLPAVCGDDA